MVRNINEAQQWSQAVLGSLGECFAASQPGTISGAPNLGHSAYVVEVTTQQLAEGRTGSILLGYDGRHLAQVLQGRVPDGWGHVKGGKCPKHPATQRQPLERQQTAGGPRLGQRNAHPLSHVRTRKSLLSTGMSSCSQGLSRTAPGEQASRCRRLW